MSALMRGGLRKSFRAKWWQARPIQPRRAAPTGAPCGRGLAHIQPSKASRAEYPVRIPQPLRRRLSRGPASHSYEIGPQMKFNPTVAQLCTHRGIEARAGAGRDHRKGAAHNRRGFHRVEAACMLAAASDEAARLQGRNPMPRREPAERQARMTRRGFSRCQSREQA